MAVAEIVKVTPNELRDADSKLAKYNGKVIETTGKIFTVYDDGSHLFLETDSLVPYMATLFEVGEDYPQKRNEIRARLSPGQTVTLRGAQQPSAITRAPTWIWQVTKTEPNPAPIVEATDLAKEYSANRSGVIAKYNNKPFYVVGEVVSQGPADEGGDLTLKGEPGVLVLCDFSNRPKDVKIGDRVQIAGVFEKFITTDREIGLKSCELIRTPLPVKGVEYEKYAP